MRRKALALVFCCVLCAAPAAAAPAPLNGVKIAFTMPLNDTGLWQSSAADCLIFTGGWSVDSTHRFVGATTHPRGLLDVSGRGGEAIVPGQGIHVDRIFGPRPKAIAASDMGLALAGRGTFLTGTIRSVRSYSARAAKRQRLVRVAGAKLAWTTTRGQLVVTVRGRASLLPPLASTLERLRCKGPRLSSRPIRPGASLGPLQATIVPAAATAHAGLFGASVSLISDRQTLLPGPTVAPTGSARQTSGRLQFAWSADPGVPTTCEPACLPSGGTVRLDGGFDIFEGATRLTFTDLAIEAAGERSR